MKYNATLNCNGIVTSGFVCISQVESSTTTFHVIFYSLGRSLHHHMPKLTALLPPSIFTNTLPDVQTSHLKYQKIPFNFEHILRKKWWRERNWTFFIVSLSILYYMAFGGSWAIKQWHITMDINSSFPFVPCHAFTSLLPPDFRVVCLPACPLNVTSKITIKFKSARKYPSRLRCVMCVNMIDFIWEENGKCIIGIKNCRKYIWM